MIITKSNRALIKAGTYRLLGSMQTFLLVWVLTGQLKGAFQVSAIEVITKIIIYYVHEMIWESNNNGK